MNFEQEYSWHHANSDGELNEGDGLLSGGPIQWTKEEEDQLKEFVQNNGKVLKTDERGRKVREKLLSDFHRSLPKFTVEEVQLKILDLNGKWRAEDVEIIISHFRENNFLWDASMTEYRNRIARNESLEELSRKIGYRKSSSEITTKFDNLRTTFNQQLKKSNTGAEGKTTKPWPYLQDLMFLKKTGVHRKSFSNFNITAETDPDVANNSFDTQPETELNEGASPSTSDQSIFEGVGIKRKHRKFGSDEPDKLKQKLMKCLDEKPDALAAFGTNVAETLRKFSDVNIEFVKTQIENVIAISLQKQSKGSDMPSFVALN